MTTSPATAAITGIKITFETTDCTRCDGTGYYGPTCINGGRCFKCGGGKRQDTRAGAFARKAFRAIIDANTAPVASLKVGDRVKWTGTWYGVESLPEATESGEVGYDNVKFKIFNRREGRKMMIMRAEASVIVYSLDVWRAAATRVARLKGATVEGL